MHGVTEMVRLSKHFLEIVPFSQSKIQSVLNSECTSKLYSYAEDTCYDMMKTSLTKYNPSALAFDQRDLGTILFRLGCNRNGEVLVDCVMVCFVFYQSNFHNFKGKCHHTLNFILTS